MWSGGGLHKFKQPQDLIICGQKLGPECRKQLNERKSSNGLSRNRSSTMRESWEHYFIDQKKKKKKKKKHGKSWRYRWKRQCPGSWRRRSVHTSIEKSTAWEKLEKLPAWHMTEVKSKKGGHSGSTKDIKKTVHFATLMDIWHLMNAELEPKNTQVGLCSEVTLWKTILALMQWSEPPAQGILLQRTRHSQILICMHRRSSWTYEKAFGKKTLLTDHEDPIAGNGVQFNESSQSCAEVYHHTSSNENSGCQSRCGQRVGKARKIASMAHDQSQEHSKKKRERSSKRHRKKKGHFI